jgi:hypothetical protein
LSAHALLAGLLYERITNLVRAVTYDRHYR